MYINFQQNLVSRSVKTVHTNLFAKICNLQLEFRKITPFGHALFVVLTDIQADFEINRPVRYIEIPQKEIISTHDGRTVKRRVRQQ